MKFKKKDFFFLIFGILIVFLICVFKGMFLTKSLESKLAILSDAFFITGVLYAGISTIIWISSQGVFDIFSYAGKVIVSKIRPKHRVPSYADFLEGKRCKLKSKGTYLYTLAFGLIMIFISVFLLFFITPFE